MAKFVGKGYTQISKEGYLLDVPSLERLAMHGTLGARKKIKLGTGITLAHGGDPTTDLSDVVEARERAHILCKALAACCSQHIKADAFNGSDYGWRNVSGESHSARYFGTWTAFEKFSRALTGIKAGTVASYVVTADKAIQHWLVALARRRQHSDHIIQDMIDMQPHIFTAPEGSAVTASSLPSSASAMAAGTSKEDNVKDKAVCSQWLYNGSCNNDDCAYAHPRKLAGASHKGGRGRQQQQQQQSQDWYWQPNWRNNNRRNNNNRNSRRGGKGGGKGGGGKGGGGGYWVKG